MNSLVEKLDMKILGERLQKVRQHLKMKQSEVAEEIGCATLTISRIERGETSTALHPLLVFYGQSIDLNMIYSADFDPEDEALYSKNPALQSHVKARLELLKSDAVDYITNTQNQFSKNVEVLLRETVDKLNDQMMNYTKTELNDLMRRLQQTIDLL